MKRIIDSDKVNIIGSKIKEARIAAGMSQQELSNKLELMAVYTCRGSISRIETGNRAVTDIEIDAISKVLNVSLDYLFEREWLNNYRVGICSLCFCIYILVSAYNSVNNMQMGVDFMHIKSYTICRKRCNI